MEEDDVDLLKPSKHAYFMVSSHFGTLSSAGEGVGGGGRLKK